MLSPGSQLSSCSLPVSPSVLGRPHSQCCLCSADDEAMATEVTPPANAELTELGKCLMKQEVSVCSDCHHPSSVLFVTFVCSAARHCCRDLGCWSVPHVRITSWEHAWLGRALQGPQSKWGLGSDIKCSYRASTVLGKRPWAFSPQGAPWLCLHPGLQSS